MPIFKVLIDIVKDFFFIGTKAETYGTNKIKHYTGRVERRLECREYRSIREFR